MYVRRFLLIWYVVCMAVGSMYGMVHTVPVIYVYNVHSNLQYKFPQPVCVCPEDK
jgi:hypothetical protein